MRREASDSPSPRGPQRASTSSMKIIEGLFSRAMLNSCFTSLWPYVLATGYRYSIDGGMYAHRSLSPIHFETRSLLLTLKNVLFASVATAFARYDFPVPGGP